MKNIVVKIGGSLLFTKQRKINTKKLTEFCDIIKQKKGFKSIVIVCGGGIIARDYIDSVRNGSDNEAMCDIMGIEISRINAKLIITHLGEDAYPVVPKTVEDVSIALQYNKIVVMGGLQPGQSTTSVAAEIAEYIKADQLVILTDVDGIFDKDPKTHKTAKLIEHLDYNQLQDLILNNFGDEQAMAGEYRIFDVVSLQILRRSNLNVLIASGENLTQFRNYWKGDSGIIGTEISN